MSEKERKEPRVHHEPIVSETLKRGATRAKDPEARTAPLRESPRARHGDALEDGSGNRHGVHERDRRPNEEA